MIKNLLIFGLMTCFSLSTFAAPQSIAHESITEAESFRVEAPTKEKEAQRSLAGAKIKKQKPDTQEKVKRVESDQTDSEVHYWQYSE